jgi:hypothetical protein
MAVVLGVIVLFVSVSSVSQAVGVGAPDGWDGAQAQAAEPPSTGECDRESNGSIVYLPSGLVPDCVVVEEGDRIDWSNFDRTPHDPGDGDLNQRHPKCWSASEWGHKLQTTATFSAEFHYEFSEAHGEETVIVRDVRLNGELVKDEWPCDPDRTEFTRNEDGDIAIPFKCYFHVQDPDGLGWIILNS